MGFLSRLIHYVYLLLTVLRFYATFALFTSNNNSNSGFLSSIQNLKEKKKNLRDNITICLIEFMAINVFLTTAAGLDYYVFDNQLSKLTLKYLSSIPDIYMQPWAWLLVLSLVPGLGLAFYSAKLFLDYVATLDEAVAAIFSNVAKLDFLMNKCQLELELHGRLKMTLYKAFKQEHELYILNYAHYMAFFRQWDKKYVFFIIFFTSSVFFYIPFSLFIYLTKSFPQAGFITVGGYYTIFIFVVFFSLVMHFILHGADYYVKRRQIINGAEFLNKKFAKAAHEFDYAPKDHDDF